MTGEVVFVARGSRHRMKFKKDIVIDMWCYRRHGHNESDEPMFTQPKMYNKIKTNLSTTEIYANRLIEKGIIDEQYYKQFTDKINKLEVKKKGKPINQTKPIGYLVIGKICQLLPKDENRRGETFIETSSMMN